MQKHPHEKLTKRMKQQLMDALLKGKDKALQYLMSDTERTPLTIEAFEKLSARCPLHQFLNYRFSDERFIYCGDNPGHFDSVLMGFDLTPLIVAGEKAEMALNALMESLPVGTLIMTSVQGSRHVEPYIEAWAMARQESDDQRFEMTTLPRCQHLIQWAKHGLSSQMASDFFRPRELRFLLSVKVSCEEKGDDAGVLSRYTRKVDQVFGQVNDAFMNAGIGLCALTGVELTTWIRKLTNLHRDPVSFSSEPINPDGSVSEQILRPTTAIEIEKTGELHFMEKSDPTQSGYVRVLSVANYPSDPHYLQDMGACIGIIDQAGETLPGDFIAYTLMECVDRKKAKRQAALTLGLLEKQTAAKSELMKSILRSLYERKEQVKQLDKKLNRSGAMKVFCGIVMGAPDKDTLKTYTEKAKQIWSQKGFELIEENAITLPMWLCTLPGQYQPRFDSNTSGLQRGTTIPCKNAVTLMQVQGDWINYRPDLGGLLLMSRRGALTVLNPFESKTGFNGIVAAITGAGKSFFVADLANDFLSRSGVVRIIDAGRSYLNMSELVQGQNMVFKRGSGLCLNMCSDLHTEADLEENKTMIYEVISLMAFPQLADRDDIKDKRRIETEFLADAITAVWHELKKQGRHLAMSVKDIADYCQRVGEKRNDQRIGDLYGLLKKWSTGSYAKWMVGRANVNFDNPLVVLELDDLSQDKELQAIILNLVITRITQEMYLNTEKELRLYGKKRPKLLIIDEAWKLLDGPVTRLFIEEAYRRARKYNASVWTIDQSFSNAADRERGTSVIISQSNFIVGLMQDKQPLLKAVEQGLIDLSDYEIDLIHSLRKTHLYSELFIKNKSTGATGLYRLAVDPVSYWTYTTKGSDRQALDQLVRSGLTTQEAIKKLAEQT